MTSYPLGCRWGYCEFARLLGMLVFLLSVPRGQAAGADLPFGRLFTTPMERDVLDRQRHHGGAAVLAARAGTVNIAQTPNQPVRLMGVVLREDGQQILWINGEQQRQTRGAPQNKIVGGKQGSADIKVRLSPTMGTLKPGQAWVPGGDSATELYQSALPVESAQALPPEPPKAPPANVSGSMSPPAPLPVPGRNKGSPQVDHNPREPKVGPILKPEAKPNVAP